MLQCSCANCSVMGIPANNARCAVIVTLRPYRDSLRLRGARGWTNDQAIEASFVDQKSVPSVQIQCRMTASLRATATFAFLAPPRFINRTPQAFSADHRLVLVSSTPAASYKQVRTNPSPHLEIRPVRSNSPDW